MNEPDILYPAIFIFSMMVIGLALTVWEFYRIKRSEPQIPRQGSPAAGLKVEHRNTQKPKFSGS